MAGIDQVLSFVVQQGANELRLGTDQEPEVFAMGARRRFTMSPTPDSALRQLLGDILSKERELELEQKRRIAFDYEAKGIGRFQVIINSRGDGLFVTFIGSGKAVGPQKDARPTVAQAAPSQRVSTNSTEGAPAALPNDSSVEPSPLRCTAALLELLTQAVHLNASDVHLADGDPAYARVNGRLQAIDHSERVDLAELFGLDPVQKQRLHRGEAVEAALELPPASRLRVSIYRMQQGLSAAVRILPDSAPDLRDLQLPASLEHLVEFPHGLVLFCGATGSGKSTSLAALCRHALQQRSILLITLEDPIEFLLHPGSRSLVRQRQVGRDVASFTSGLRDALRADPDVVMVGELRDSETIRLALTAAETGHLVLASIHSGSSAACIERIVDAYPSEQRSQIRVQLADALRAVVVQKLLPKARGAGRIAALEMLRVTHAVANVIREGKTAQIGTQLQSGKRDGMFSLERCLADYVQAGAIQLEHAKAAANDPDSLAMYLAK